MDQQYGHYLIYDMDRDLIGEGGQARVYRAEDRNTGRTVALKVLKTDHADQEFRDRFEREARVLAQLHHPHILTLLEYNNEGMSYYLVTNYLAKGSLAQEIQKPRRFTLQEVYAFAIPLLQALDYAHRRNLVHRDINPYNILLNEDGSPVLSDFGLAKILPKNPDSARPKGPASAPMGTARYMAPEQWHGHATPQSDLYSVGVVLYEMLSELLQGPLVLKDGRPRSLCEINSGVSRGLEAAIFRAFWVEPGQRYKSAAEFLGALEMAKELEKGSSDPIEQYRTSPLPQPSNPSLLSEQNPGMKPQLPVNSSSSQSDPSQPPARNPANSPANQPNQSQPAGQRNKPRWKLPALLILVLLLASSGGWVIRGVADQQSLFFPQWTSILTPTPCFQTITSLSDDGSPGTFRKALSNILQGQTCNLLFTASGTLILTRPLPISQNLIIAAPALPRQSDQAGQPNHNQVTIRPQDPSVGIAVGVGSTVSFQNISFQGLGPRRPSQPAAFIQIASANVVCLHCDFSDFYSHADGSAISNSYGDLVLENTTLEGNISRDNGGALYNLGSISAGKGTLILDNCTFSQNVANYGGGGIYNLEGWVQISKSILSGNSTAYNDDEVEGGGAIASWDGVLGVSGSWISGNSAAESGGGILLVGTTAQIIDTQILNNQTEVVGQPAYRLPGEGGGIAVETNSATNELSVLDLISSPVMHNTNNYPSPTPTNDYSGILSKTSTPQRLQITSTPLPAPPSKVRHLIDFLTIDLFTKFCQKYKDTQGQPFTAAVLASTGGGTIDCVTANTTQRLESLVSLLQREGLQTQIAGMQGAVQFVCESIYGNQMKNIIARLFNYWDPASWQCLPDEQRLKVSIKKTNLDSYCQSLLSGSSAMLANQDSNPTAYDWNCVSDGVPYRISMDVVCQQVSGNPDAIGLLDPADFNKPNNWQCWG